MNPSPSKPSLHVQLKLPSVSVQLALELHVWVPNMHSSISVKVDGMKQDTIKLKRSVIQQLLLQILYYSILLVQLTPSPVYPGLQVQIKLPSVLVQFAFS